MHKEESNLRNRLDILNHPVSMVLLLVLVVTFSCTKISYSSYSPSIPSDKAQRFQPVIDVLLSKGVDSHFVFSLVAAERTVFNEKYVKINVTGYLTSTDYTQFYNDQSIDKTKLFLDKYKEPLEKAEQKYGVPKEVIASVLWIETRHGSYLGNNHIPSVYLSTALTSQNEFVELNIIEMDSKFKGTQKERNALVEKIKARSKKKSAWAIGEIIALEKIQKRFPIPIDSIYGSWAGAFGISQFLPSSYKAWAVDGNGDNIVNLFDYDDAIHSVGNYLKSNGWGDSEEARRKAVYHYNNSRAYVDAVLTLAELAKK